MQSDSQVGDPRLAAALARLDALINWERMQRTGAMRVSIDPERDLLRRIGNPERSMRAVHVAGSKGKGTTSALIAAGLSHAGLSVALYTSPHVERIHERLRLGSALVGDRELAEGLEQALAAREAAVADGGAAKDATWFDVFTAAAFWIAARSGAQWLVAECGLGGRLDSTNVITGEVCVITNIELEHTAVLGSTRAQIAGEKAGILKTGTSLVTGVPAEDEAGRAIDKRANELDVPVHRPLRRAEWERASIAQRNLALAGFALDELGRRGVRGTAGEVVGRSLLEDSVVAEARLPGRLERFDWDRVAVVLDGGHVPASIRDVLRDLGAMRELKEPPVVVLGMARDKDLPGILKALRFATDRVVCTSVGSALHYTPEEIAGQAASLGVVAETAATPRMALERAVSLAHRDTKHIPGWVLVVGSLYLAGSLRPLLAHRPPRSENA